MHHFIVERLSPLSYRLAFFFENERLNSAEMDKLLASYGRFFPVTLVEWKSAIFEHSNRPFVLLSLDLVFHSMGTKETLNSWSLESKL